MLFASRAKLSCLMSVLVLNMSALMADPHSKDVQSLLKDRFGKRHFVRSVIDKSEWKELKVDDFVELQNTKTPMGSWSLSGTLVPQSDRLVIQEHQAQLRALLNDPELLELSTQALSTIPDACKTCDTYLQAKDLGSLSAYYYGPFLNPLNRDELFLSGAFAVEAAKRLTFLIAPLGLSGLDDKAKLDFFKGNQKSFMSYFSPSYMWEGFKEGMAAPVRWHAPWTAMLSNEQDIKAAKEAPGPFFQNLLWGHSTLGDFYTYGSNVLGLSKPLVGALIVTSMIGRDVYLGVQIKASVDYLRDLWSKPLKIAQGLTHLGRSIQACRALAQKLRHHKAFQSIQSQKMLAFLACDSDYISKDLTKAIELSIEISESSSINLLLRGRVLLAHKLLFENTRELADFLCAVGYIDALCAMTELYQNHCQLKPWAFVNFVDSSTPYIKARNTWCPLIGDQEAVLNTIAMDDSHPRVMICTGPNGGGKSTIMKGLAYQVLLGQSWGIVPAESCTMGIFGSMRTALDPHEDIKKGLSSFMAQRKRMNELESQAHESKKMPMVLLVDEPYRGTVEATSQQLVTSFCSSIGECEDVALFLATHYQQPTMLAESNSALFVNVQCLFDTDETGRMYRTFKLAPGAATWWFTDDHARSQYLSMLEAETIA